MNQIISKSMRILIYVFTIFFLFEGCTKTQKEGDDVSVLKYQANDISTSESNITSVVFSPDGEYYASAGSDSMVTIRDFKTKSVVCQTQKYDSWIHTLAFHPSGKFIISTSGDYKIKIISVHDGAVVRELESTMLDYPVAVSSDGKMLASGGSAYFVTLRDFDSGEKIKTFGKDSISSVSALAFSPDGKFLAAGGEDQKIHIWNVESGREISTLKGNQEWINSLSFSPDGKYIVTADLNSSTEIWDWRSNKIFKRLNTERQQINDIKYSPDGKFIAAGRDDGTIIVWNVLTGTETKFTNEKLIAVNSLAFSPDSRYVLTGGDNNTVLVWDLKKDLLLAN